MTPFLGLFVAIPLALQTVLVASAALQIAESEAHGSVATVKVVRSADIPRGPQTCNKTLGLVAFGSPKAQRAIPVILQRLTPVAQTRLDHECARLSVDATQAVVVMVEGEADFSTEIRKGPPRGAARQPDERFDRDTATVTLTF
jgi:hypothetical protein